MNLERTLHPTKGEARPAALGLYDSGDDALLMERVVERERVILALARVQQNKGSPGIDGMTVESLRDHLRGTWPTLRKQLLAGTYKPQSVKRVEIPKANGGMRELGIPTVVDRFIQQAVLQILQPRLDPSFSESSYGFRPGRRAHEAVCAAQKYIQEGRRWVVDVDLEKFFDRVNHDVLMSRVAKRVADKRLLRLIGSYLVAGIMANGVDVERTNGVPQGGPLSPLLANVLLDEIDKELEKRGHAFVRYADDCNVYVRSRKAGERVMKALQRSFERLRLRINESKSAVARPWERKFLGYSFWVSKGIRVGRRISDQAIAKMKARVRSITARHGRSIASMIVELRSFLLGWRNYFYLAETPRALRTLESWIRRRLRAVQLRHWKRSPRIIRELVARGIALLDARWLARHTGRWWFQSRSPQMHRAFPVSYYDGLGLPRLATQPIRTAGCGPACPVVWQGSPA